MRMKKWKWPIAAGAALAVLAAFCLWYTRPRSWRDIAGAQNEEITSLAASNVASYWRSAEDFGFDVWKMDADQAEGAAIEAVTRAFDGHSYRASLGNLFLPFKDGYSIDDPGGSIHLSMVLRNPHWETPSVYGNGQVYFSSGFYYTDQGLYEELARIIQAYGTFQEG